jgi:hypothetical protein
MYIYIYICVCVCVCVCVRARVRALFFFMGTHLLLPCNFHFLLPFSFFVDGGSFVCLKLMYYVIFSLMSIRLMLYIRVLYGLTL